MKTLAYHCSLYIDSDPDEDMKETAERLERILEDIGLEYQYYDMEFRDEDGNVVED